MQALSTPADVPSATNREKEAIMDERSAPAASPGPIAAEADPGGEALGSEPTRPPPRAGWVTKSRRGGYDILALFLAVQVLCVSYALIAPDRFAYLSEGNITVMLQAIPELGIVAVGVGLLMISGEFDLSVGTTYTLTAIVMATLVTDRGMSPWLAMLVALVLGTVIGLINAAITFLLKIPSFIATLGASLFWAGFTLFLHGASFLGFNPEGSFASVFSGSVGLIQAAFIWFVVCALGAGLLLHRHRLGNRLYAVGANQVSAAAVGVKTSRTKTIAFAITGLLAAFSGVIATTRVNSIVPGQGSDLPLLAIAACVIGGLVLNGGRGTVLGIAVGAALIYTIQDVLLLLRTPGFYLNLFVGLLIIAAAGLNQLAKGRSS